MVVNNHLELYLLLVGNVVMQLDMWNRFYDDIP